MSRIIATLLESANPVEKELPPGGDKSTEELAIVSSSDFQLVSGGSIRDTSTPNDRAQLMTSSQFEIVRRPRLTRMPIFCTVTFGVEPPILRKYVATKFRLKMFQTLDRNMCFGRDIKR
jgi:hypothetical protein